jgi:hypothetical protein
MVKNVEVYCSVCGVLYSSIKTSYHLIWPKCDKEHQAFVQISRLDLIKKLHLPV